MLALIYSTSYSLELRAGKGTDTALSNLTSTDNTAVDSAGHTVLLLNVKLGESVSYSITIGMSKIYPRWRRPP